MRDSTWEAARQEAAAQAAAVLRQTREFYVAIDEAGRVLAWNRSAARTFGWSEDEALGRDVHDLIIPSSSRAAHLAGVERFRTTGRGRGLDGPVEVEALTRSGGTVPVELVITAQRGRDAWTFHVLGHDVVERRAQERVLQLLAGHREQLLRSEEEHEVRTLLCATARQALCADGAYLYELVEGRHEPGGHCVGLAAQSLGVALPGLDDVELGARSWSLLLRDGRISVPDLAAARGSEADGLRAGGLRSAVVEALRSGDRLLGVLVLGWVAPRPLPDEADRRLLSLLASEATLVVERLTRHESQREAARTDALTGLLNRRAFEDGAVRAVERALAGAGPLVLAMLDLDGFKALNDAHGHPAGDTHLQRVAHAWREALGDEPGELYRFGGDEFALLLPLDREQARRVVERLTAATPPPTGVTHGLAVAGPGDTVEALLARADDALYARKRAR